MASEVDSFRTGDLQMLEWLEGASEAVLNSAVIGMGMVGLVGEAPAHFPLDTMMAGFAEACTMSPELEAFWSSAIGGEAIVLPETADHYFGEPQIRIEDEFREIRIPVEGMWMGHEVDHFALFAGNDNGIAVLTVRFAPEDADVAGTFALLAEVAGERLAVDPENHSDVSASFVSEGGISQYSCDYST